MPTVSPGSTRFSSNERLLLEAQDPCRYVLEQRMALQPGDLFNYSGGATTPLAAALAKAVDRGIDVYAREKLFEPLGITDVEWLSFTGSAEPAAFAGLRLRPRDLAKLGQLVADGGRWNSRHSCPPRGSPSRPGRMSTPRGTPRSTMAINGGLAVPW
ncbi:serine hydrolase [Bradyrhizobium sp. INPA03-11B]|uniref:serine hydrolase n=1 Tax=Bradyrhizobium sp. INPA03-11B TaxID=418598 RepID=UPI00338E1C02